jgi:hypothetical protein
MTSQTPNVFTYPRNEPGTTGHLELVEPLRALAKQLDDALKGITDAEAVHQLAEGEWCIKEQVGHLRDAEEMDHKRLFMMSTQTDPVLEPYDQDAFAREHGYSDRDLGEMLDEFRRERGQTVALLTSLVNWNWARTGQHRETGRRSIRQYVESMVRHDAVHLEEVRRLRAQARTALGLD